MKSWVYFVVNKKVNKINFLKFKSSFIAVIFTAKVNFIFMKKITVIEKKTSKNDGLHEKKDLSKSTLQDKRAAFLKDHFKNKSKKEDSFENDVISQKKVTPLKTNLISTYEEEINNLKLEVENLKKLSKVDIKSQMSGVMDKLLPDFVHEISSPVSILDNALENLLLQYGKVMDICTALMLNESTKDGAGYIYNYTQSIDVFLVNVNHNLQFRENKKLLVTQLSVYNFKNVQYGADHLLTAGIVSIDENLHSFFCHTKGADFFDLLISLISIKQSFSILNTAKVKSKNLIVSIKNYTSRSSESVVELFDLKSSLDSALVMVGHRLRSRRFNFSYDVSCFVLGDIKKLSHIWINLLSNAIEATNSNGTINLNVFLENKDVIISIQDDGSGISDENLVNIFNPNFTTKNVQAGIGVGLDFCKTYLEYINAKLDVVSKPGDTTFTVRISSYANSLK